MNNLATQNPTQFQRPPTLGQGGPGMTMTNGQPPSGYNPTAPPLQPPPPQIGLKNGPSGLPPGVGRMPSQPSHGFPPQQQNQGLPPQPGHPPQSGSGQGISQQPGYPPQAGNGLPPQPGHPSQPGPGQGLSQQPQPGYPPQAAGNGLSPQQGHPSQPGHPPQPGHPSQPGHHQQPGHPSQPGHPPQPGHLPQSGHLPQPGHPSQPGPGQGLSQQPQPGYPPQPAGNGLPPQPGYPPHQGQSQGLSQQPGYPPQPQPSHGLPPPPQPGYPPQPGQGQGLSQQPGQQPQHGHGLPPQPSYPPQPGHGLGMAQQPPPPQQGHPPQHGQGQGLPPQPGYPPLPGQGLSNRPNYPPPPGMGQGQGHGLPPQPQPGYPPQPGQAQGLPQQPGYPPQPGHGLPSQPGYQPGQGGYPPQQPQPLPGPGYPPQPQGPGVGYPGAGLTPNQGRKLDPEHMPSAIGVMQEDQQGRGGTFQTGQRGLLPPLVTTKFQVEDMGNASPRFVRSTMYAVPAQPDMLKQTAVPFALVVNPFEDPGEGEAPLACVDLGPMGPVRCIRCKAYMSPLMQFIDGGRRFQCLLCKATTEVPPEYFQHLDHTGQRVDKWERPELWRGSYEFMATLEYCRNSANPKEPGYIFVIDVSYNNIKSGLVSLICNQMATLLEAIPPHTPVGFITYNSKVHFYNIDPSLTQPQMIIVPDVSDMFMPILTGFMVPREDASKSISALMIQIPAMFGDTKETDAVLGPAIQAGLEALKASERAGKLLVLHSSLPSSDAAPGKLKNREAERKLLGTDKEKVVLTPQSTYYNTLGQECVGNGVSVDLYLFNNSYIDVATIGQVARVSGGSVNKYTYFQADIDGPRVIGELKIHLSRPTGFDGVMRVRTSTGVRPTDFHGHFFMSNTTDIELGAIDSYKGIAVEIKHDDKLGDDEGVYIQIALLYTSIYGQRRIRIHNLALNTCLQMADLYRNCELDTIVNFLSKQCISKSVEATPQTIKEGVTSRCAQMLATYRKHCANPSMPGQLILPECLKLLPLYINCVLRSDAVSGNQELTPDDRSWLMYTVMTMGVGSSVHYFYPKLIPITGPTAQPDNPLPIRCSHDKLRDDSAFILENGIYIFLWIGSAVSSDWLQNIFGISNLAQINVEVITELPEQVNTDESLQLKALIRSLRSQRQRHMRLTVVRQRDKMELVMNKFLVEDRSTDGHPSYVDFLCHMHKEIRGILNQ